MNKLEVVRRHGKDGWYFLMEPKQNFQDNVNSLMGVTITLFKSRCSSYTNSLLFTLKECTKQITVHVTVLCSRV